MESISSVTPAPPLGVLDPRITLATALHSQPGVYALLIGSGTSTGAGIPTGWGVVKALVDRAAAADGTAGDVDPEVWWAEHGDGRPLGYSGLLEDLASTPAARRALLAGFFEPTQDDRDDGRKMPSAAHRAIAQLVRRGTIRVIVTTNFDRLLEQALEAEGISPQVIAAPGAIVGMEPLAHARCTVIKLHGDYARIDQLNTVEELRQYAPEMKALLERILDEYGLVINGWSGDWDAALVEAIQGTRARRYPLFWASYGSFGVAASQLVAQHRAHVIKGMTADQFFTDTLSRLESLDRLVDPPLSQAMAVARLKKALPDRAKYIELRDMFDSEIGRIRTYIALRGQTSPGPDTSEFWQSTYDEIRARSDTLIHLLAQGVYLDRDRQHTDLWIWVIEQLMRARPQPIGQYHLVWVNLHHYPALLALRAVELAAVGARHDNVLLQVTNKPMWKDQLHVEAEPALEVLNEHRVLGYDAVNAFPRWSGQRWLYPLSHLLKAELRPVLLPLVGDNESYEQLFHRTEYRVALAESLAAGDAAPQPTGGEYIGSRSVDRSGGLFWETDFREHADRAEWGWRQVQPHEADPFSDRLDTLTTRLKEIRRYG